MAIYQTNKEDFFIDMEYCKDVLVLFMQEDCEPCHKLMEVLEDYEGDVMMFDIQEDYELPLEANVKFPSTLVLYHKYRPTTKVFAKGFTLEQVNEYVEKRRNLIAKIGKKAYVNS